MARLFISHSHANNAAAIALCEWLAEQGFTDVFLDVDPQRGLVAGQRWQEALKAAADRCEAVLFLVSPAWLGSMWCLAEFLLAKTLHKRIFGLIVEPVPLDKVPVEMTAEWQMCQLVGEDPQRKFDVPIGAARETIAFREAGLDLLRRGLERAGIDAKTFRWPPPDEPSRAPYRGLRALEAQDAAIFFGRDAAIIRGLDRIRGLVESDGANFLVVVGASGAGKSSFLRAGLWPRLSRDDTAFLTLPVVRPQSAAISGSCGLAAALAGTFDRFSAQRSPGRIKEKLAEGAKGLGSLLDELSNLAKERLVGVAEGQRELTVLLPIDQAEELFIADASGESGALLKMIAGTLAPAEGEAVRRLLVLATIRSDRYELLQTAQSLLALKQDLFNLPPIQPTEFKSVIEGPAHRVVEAGGRLTIEPALTEQLISDAQGADALPLLAFTLERLYADYGGEGALTLAEYMTFGGVQGSIEKAIGQALIEPGRAPPIPASNEEQLACLRGAFIPWLATVDSKTGVAIRRSERLDRFRGASRPMVDRLVEARLLVVDRRDGADIVEVAHESLLRQWPPLAAWLKAAADDLRVAEAVEVAADEWLRNKKKAAWLDHRGDRLAAAERMAKDADFCRRLGDNRLEYLKACRSRENLQRHIRQGIAALIAIAFVLAGLAVYSWRDTVRARKESEASLLIAQSGAYLANGNIAAAIERARLAFTSLPSVASRSAFLQAAMEVSSHLRATLSLGSDAVETLAWSSGDALDAATQSLRLRRFALVNAEPSTGWALPTITRRIEGNPAVVRALSPLGADRMIAVFDEGTVGVYRRDGATISLQTPSQQIPVFGAPQAVAISESGASIALVRADEAIVLYRCDWTASTAAPDCKAAPFGDVHGRSVAISGDEKRIAVGDQAGNVTTYDLAGKPIAGPRRLSGPVIALGWAPQRDWLAAGTAGGDIAVFDTNDQTGSPIARQSFGHNPITALAWSPTALNVAFVCNGSVVCVWQANAHANPAQTFKPAMLFEGHGNAVTRLSFSPDGSQLASAATDGTIRIWSLAQDPDAGSAMYADAPTAIATVSVSPDGHWIAGGGNDGAIMVWDAKTGALVRDVRSSGDFGIEDLAWNAGNVLASIDSDNTVEIVPAGMRQAPVNVPIRGGSGHHIAWANDGGTIAAPCGYDGIVLIDAHSQNFTSVAVGSPGRKDDVWGAVSVAGTGQLITSYVGGGIKMWDLTSKTAVPFKAYVPANPADAIGVGSLAVSPDRRLVATSSGDGSVPIYDIAGRQIWRVLKTESRAIAAVGFSPDGKMLAAIGSDGRLYLWTLSNGEPELYLAISALTHRGIVGDPNRSEHASWMAWISQDQIAVASNVEAIRIVNIDPASWLRRIDALALAAAAPID